MKTYSIDYTKISEAESSLYSATRLMANDCPDAALERIQEARKLLQEFTNQDNLVEDDDLADGLVRQSEAETTIKKELVDKACEWLATHLNEYVYTDSAGISRGDDGGLVYRGLERVNPDSIA